MWIDIPKDVQAATIELETLPEPGERAPAPAFAPESVREAAAMINAAKRPVLYLGGAKPEKQITVPDLTGKSLSNARTTLQNMGLYVLVSGGVSDGTQTVTKQDVAHGTQVAYGSVIMVETADTSQQSH